VTPCKLVDIYHFFEQLAASIFREEKSLHLKQWQYFPINIDKHLPNKLRKISEESNVPSHRCESIASYSVIYIHYQNSLGHYATIRKVTDSIPVAF
jgi:hypothetical protein